MVSADADPRRGAKVRWTASPPGGASATPAETAPQEPYTGPPSYPATPRWGFPNLVWRLPTMVPGTQSGRPDPREQQRIVGSAAVAALIVTAVVAALACAAEAWRYALLVASREDAVSAGQVKVSDAVIEFASRVVWAPAAVALVLSFWWLLIVRDAVARAAGVAPPRTVADVTRRVWTPVVLIWIAAVTVYAASGYDWRPPDGAVWLVGPVLVVLVFVTAVVLTCPVVVELEHVAAGRGADDRLGPSLLVLVWAAAWVANVVLAAVTLMRRMQEGVQAEADAVLLTAVTNAAAAALAVLTVAVVRRVMALIAPKLAGTQRRQQVVSVQDAPPPPLRPTRPAGAKR